MRRVEKGSTAEVTHTSMGKPKGSFSIRKNEMGKFFELYDKAYSEGEHIYLIERHTDFGPMVIDLDFEYLPDVDERQHDEEHIRGIVKLYQEEIMQMFQVDEDSDKLTAFVFEKDHPYKKKEKDAGDASAGAGATTGGNKVKCTKDGIHIMFPFIVSTPEPQYIIRDKILDRIGTVLDPLPITASKNKDGKISYTNVVDKSVIQANGWFLFGSTKPGHEEYKITHILRPDMTEIPVEQYDFNGMNPPRFFSIRNKNETDIVPVREENLDVIGRFRATEQKRKEKKALSAAGHAVLSPEEIKIVREFVSIMSDQRANDYTSWIEVGWALHNLGPSSQDLLDAWIDFSKRSPKFQDGHCEALWENMKDEGLGIGSIRYWARLDNPDLYKKIIMNDINKMIETSIKMPTVYDIATVLHRMFKYDYKYSPQGTWYYFDNHLWRENNDGILLRNKISTDLCDKYAEMIQGNNNNMIKNADLTDEDKEDLKARNKEILSIIAKLRTTSFKDNIIRECRELFYDVEFLNKLDENFYLIGFQNGIYDLKRMELREGRPDDYVTLTTRINKIEFSEEHEQWPELSKFIYTIFPKEEKRHYFMTFLSSCLQGLNAEEKFRVWTGTGCHAMDTPIMMADGSWKMVQDIVPGEQLMGDDSTPRNVLELFRGHSSMYRINTIKGESFIVNGDHILCLKATTMGSLTNSKKESRYKLLFQIRGKDGLPINKAMNFAYKSSERKEYKKGVTYYETPEDARQAGLDYWTNAKRDSSYIHCGDVIEVKVTDYLKYQKSVFGRNYFVYKSGVTFDKKDVPFDPYIMGYWLGDGTSQLASITTMDAPIVEYFDDMAKKNNLNVKVYDKDSTEAKTYVYSSKAKSWNNKDYDNKFYVTLRDLKMLNNKHIPEIYMKNSREIQLQMLAGIIDSDGHYQKKSNQYEITLVNEKLIDDTMYICQSLGFACTKRVVSKSCGDMTGTYYNLIVYGSGIEEIPVKLERKKAHARIKNKNHFYYGFTVEKVDDDNFYGFQLDGNHRYIMDKFIVTHNSNGKSKLEELFTASFGDYTIKFPITLLTGKRAASNACSPELVKAKGKRIGYFVEPSEGERVNAGLMKEFTGGDKIYARGLNKDPIEFKPQFKLSLLCNDVPHFPPKDTGVWRRVEIVEFESKFVDNPNPENPNEFPIDKKVTEKIQQWKELFMAYLIDVYYAQYKVTGMKVPEEVLKFTIEYQKMFDMYSEFISRVIVETGVMSDTVTLSELHEEFKNWFLEMYNSPKVPTKHEFRQYMEKTYGKKRVTPMEVKGIKTKMKIEEEKKKKEAEEKAQLVKVDGVSPDGMIENGDDDEEGGVEDEDAEFMRLMSGSGKGAAADEDEPDFEEEFERHLREGTLDRSSSVSKYFTDMPKPKPRSAPTPAPTTMVTRNGGTGNGSSTTTTTTTTTSYVNGKLVQGGANPFASFPPIPGMPGGGDPFANFPKPPGFVQAPGQNQVTTTNNEYTITSMDDLENLKIPGMAVHDNPVLKALYRKDMESIEELRRVEYKQTGPTSYQLPTITLPPEKKVETYVDEFGNRTTTTTINTTNNIPTINFDGLPEGFTGNPFKLLADKMEEKILRRRRPPPPPVHMMVASAIFSSIMGKKLEEEEEKRRQQREEKGEPEPSEEEKRRQAEEDEERFRKMLENGEIDVDVPPDHPVLVAFGQMMKDAMRQEIEHKVRSDPNIPPEKVDEVLKEIFEEEERDRRHREMNMPESGILLRRRPETPPNYFRRGFMLDDDEMKREKREPEIKIKPKPEYPAHMSEEEMEYLEYMRLNGIEPVELTEEELAYEMARADAIEREADEELARLEMEYQAKRKAAAAAPAPAPAPVPVPVSLVVEEVEEEKKKPIKKKVTVKKNKD